jgi:Rrf2 family iron-sulfur cluster assembly transcriptional regulator
MIDLALRDKAYPVPLSELALRHGISLSYLEQVFSKLRQQGLVESTRGPGGGYTLGFRGDRITVADIVGAIDERDVAGGEGAPRDGALNTQDLWESLNTALFEHMRTITLKSLADDQKSKGFKVQERKTPKKGVLQKLKMEPMRPNVPNSVFALGQAWRAA